MGTKQFDTMQDEVKLALGQRSDLSNLLDDWVNDAYIRLTTANNFWGMKVNAYFPTLEIESSAINTSDGTACISTPSDCLFIRHVWDSTNDVKLTKMSWAQYVAKTGRADSDSEDKPTEWVRHADDTKGSDKIYLYPTPDATYAMKVYYRAIPAVLTGTDTTVIGSEWDEAIVTLACVIGSLRLRDFEAAEVFKKEFKDIIRGLAGVYYQEDLDKDDYIKPSPAYLDFEY